MAAEGEKSVLGNAMLTRRSLLHAGLVGLAGIGAAAMIGCGDDDDDDDGAGAGTSTPGATATTSPAATPTPTTSVRDLTEDEFWDSLPENPPKDWSDADIKAGGQQIRMVGNTSANPALDFLTPQGGRASAEYYAPVYSRLVRFSSRQGMESVVLPELEEDLAVLWERPPGFETAVFTLAPGIKWQNLPPVNGRDFVGEDIALSFEYGKSSSIYKTEYERFESVATPDPQTVQLNLSRPDPIIDSILTLEYMSIMPPELLGSDEASATMVGTGGMMLDSRTPGVETTFVKNPEFFKKDALGKQRPYLDEWVITVVADVATQQAVFQVGDAQSMTQSVYPFAWDNLYQLHQRFPGEFVSQLFPSPYSAWSIMGHHTEEPWSDARFRRALSMCMPRQAAMDNLYRGNANVGPYFPWASAFDERPTIEVLGPNFEFNVSEAKKLVAAAGYPDGVEIPLNYFSYPTQVDPVITLLQESAADAGIKLGFVVGDPATVSGEQRSKAWTGLMIQGRRLAFQDPLATLPVYLTGSSLNYADVSDSRLDALADQLSTAVGEERREISRQIFELQTSEMYDIPLPQPDYLSSWRREYKNFVNTSWAGNAGAGMGQADGIWLQK